MPTHEILVIAMLLTFIALIFTGFPIAWVLSGVALLFANIAVLGYTYLDWDTDFLTSYRLYGIFIQRIYAQMSNWIMVALPMFIFMGLMLERSGVTEKLMVNFVQTGRTGVFEVLEISKGIREAILKGKPAMQIREIAQSEGMMTLEQAMRSKVQRGITSIEELHRVISTYGL
jgi:hypothetical protein